MQKRASSSLAALVLGLSLAAASGTALAKGIQESNQDKHRTDGSATHSMSTHDATWSAGRVKVMQAIVDKDISNENLVSILPLLYDLRDARAMCDAKHSSVYTDLQMSRGDSSKVSADTAIRDCERELADRQRDIWNTISDRIGSDKASSLRYLVEPRTEDMSRVAYTTTRIQRIDTMIQDLDKMAAARIAAQGGNPDQSGVRAASVETTSTVTTQTPGMAIHVTTPAVITERELAHVVAERIVANEIGNSDWAIFMPMHGDLKSTDLTFMREGKMKVWW